MTDLADNSGPYNPDRKYEDFSKEFLIKLAKAYQACYILLEGFWNTEVTNSGKFTEEEIMDLELKVWTRTANVIQPKIAKLTNIELPVKDMVEGLKLWQVLPESTINEDVYLAKMDIIDNDHIINTLVRCRTLEWLEEHSPERIDAICRTFEYPAWQAYCRALHPDIKVTPVHIPSCPRKSKDEIACSWDMKLERK